MLLLRFHELCFAQIWLFDSKQQSPVTFADAAVRYNSVLSDQRHREWLSVGNVLGSRGDELGPIVWTAVVKCVGEGAGGVNQKLNWVSFSGVLDWRPPWWETSTKTAFVCEAHPVQFSVALRPQRPRGLLRRGAQDGHLDFYTAPELWSWPLHVSI